MKSQFKHPRTLNELYPETYGLKLEDLAAATVLKQYITDHGATELAQALHGNEVDAALVIHLIDKAKALCVESVEKSGMNAKSKKKFMSVMDSINASSVMGDIDPKMLDYLSDLLMAARG